MKKLIILLITTICLGFFSSCTDPYDPADDLGPLLKEKIATCSGADGGSLGSENSSDMLSSNSDSILVICNDGIVFKGYATYDKNYTLIWYRTVLDGTFGRESPNYYAKDINYSLIGKPHKPYWKDVEYLIKIGDAKVYMGCELTRDKNGTTIQLTVKHLFCSTHGHCFLDEDFNPIYTDCTSKCKF